MLPLTPAPERLAVVDGICRAHPNGRCTLVEAVDLVESAIAHCRAHRISRLLFNATALVGIPMPTLVDRFLMVEQWAAAANGMVTVALVVDAQYIHPKKFGVVVAMDLGLTCDVCTSEDEALRWLAGLEAP